MKHFSEFASSGDSFADRYGDPDEASSAIGLVAVAFSDLEEGLSAAIEKLLGVDAVVARVVTCEMSFRNKVNAMASLIRSLKPDREINLGTADRSSLVSELAAACFRAEEMRNQIMHSIWTGSGREGGSMTRTKYSAKASHGLRRQVENLNSAYLLDVADYISMVAFDLTEVFLTL